MKKIDRTKIESMFLAPDSTVRQAMAAISRGGIGVAFITDPARGCFIGVLTDGDIRRMILGGGDLETRIDSVQRPLSVVAREGAPIDQISKLFGEKVRVVPILDIEDRIVDIALLDQRVRLPVAEPTMGENELAYVTDCIVSNWISSTGKYVTRFETMFAEFCGARCAVAASNGTTALHLSLLALGIGPGDEVIVPSMTFIATANAVTYTGAKPVFVDSEPGTWNIDPQQVRRAVTARTKAVIPVHLYGHPADMDPLLDLAREKGLAVIEDAAEAHGAEYKGRKVGAIGTAGVFSFYGNKIITTGEGGMIVTNDLQMAEKMRLFRDHGMSPTRRYWHTVVGYNYRLTNIQAAIGVAQLERIGAIIATKLAIAARYEQGLRGIPGIGLPPREPWAKNVYWLYSILVEKEFGMTRDDLIRELAAHDIETRPFFPAVHHQPVYNTADRLPVAEALAEKGLSLPSSAGLQDHEVDRVCQAIREIQKKTISSRVEINGIRK